jgi:hypothetical protein
MERITARTNDRIKYAVRLGESASFRRECGEFFLEGARLCFDAAKNGIKIADFKNKNSLKLCFGGIKSDKIHDGVIYLNKILKNL